MITRTATTYRSPSSASVQPRAPMSGTNYGTLNRRPSPGMNSASPFGYPQTNRPTAFQQGHPVGGVQRPQGVGWAQGRNVPPVPQAGAGWWHSPFQNPGFMRQLVNGSYMNPPNVGVFQPQQASPWPLGPYPQVMNQKPRPNDPWAWLRRQM